MNAVSAHTGIGEVGINVTVHCRHAGMGHTGTLLAIAF